MKIGDLVKSKHPKIYGESFGVIVAVRQRPSVAGPRPPRYAVHWLRTGPSESFPTGPTNIPGIDLRKVA